MIKPEILQGIKDRYAEVTHQMAQPEVATDPACMARLGREHGTLHAVVEAIGHYERLLAEIDSLHTMIDEEADPEFVYLAQAELEELALRLPQAEAALESQLIPKDPEDARDAIVEIRAGTGGDEASLFAGDLFRLYSRFAEQQGWRIDVFDSSPGTVGGFKEIIFGLRGPDAFGAMKYESGVHRVQRVPATESQGRIHTSAATVAVLPEAEEVDVQIHPNDLRIDVYRSSGPGGQSVNTTDSAVRITHLPTGLVVSIQDEKSQLKNKDKALRVLRARLYERELARQEAERSEARRSMVSTGDRSAKIRTYNFPQNRVTDHRLEGEDKNHALESVMEGHLDPIIRALRTAEHAEHLAKLG
jgi:peptide chain release factor 1